MAAAPTALTTPHGSSQAKAGANALAYGMLVLHPLQRPDTLPGRIQKHQGGVAHLMAGRKGAALRRTQIRQDKRHLAAKLGSEHVDDALKLGTIGSPR
jgi:hypothetical protein